MPLYSRSLLEHLWSRLSDIIAKSTAIVNSEVLSVTLALPEWPLSKLPSGITGYRYCAYPEAKRVLLGSGAVLRITTTGSDRLRQIQQTLFTLSRNWVHIDPDDTGLQPHAFLAFAFDPNDPMLAPWEEIPNTLFEIPAVLLQQHHNESGITFTYRPLKGKPDTDVKSLWRKAAGDLLEGLLLSIEPTVRANRLTHIAACPEERVWLDLAKRARDDIWSQKLSKIVLARHISVQGEHNFDPSLVMEFLAERYPNCVHIAIDLADRVLVAASPERLVTVNAGKVSCEAVAGTTRRVSDTAPGRRLDLELLRSTKGLHEHAFVVEHMVAALKKHCTRLQIPSEPEILSLRFMYHLRSLLRANLQGSSTIIDLIEDLHPTPAVGGDPVDAALEWLRAYEPVARGWYTGAFGWLTPGGDGDFAMILRCALLRDNHADLFAGAGIVMDSEPVAELEETWFKLQTILDVLQDV